MDVDTATMHAVTEERGDQFQIDTSLTASTSTSTDSSNKIIVDDVLVTLVTSDEKKITMSRTAACQIEAFRDLIGDLGVDKDIPLPNVTEDVLLVIKEYAEYKVVNPNPPEPVPDPKKKNAKPVERRSEDILPWDKAFMAKLQLPQIYDLLIAINALKYKDLFDLGTKTVANMAKGKSVEELRTTFNLVNDFTPEQEAANIAENSWYDERL